MCNKKNSLFLSFGKRIDVFMSKKNKQKKKIIIEFLHTERRKKKREHTHGYVCEREFDFYSVLH